MSHHWIITPRPARSPAVRLVCFPHAGGGAASFSGWHERLPSAEIGVVQLPGRGSRVCGPLIESLPAAADGVADAVGSLPVYPTVLFGHSLGALVAFETARRLRLRGWPLLALFVSGCPAPALRIPEPHLAAMPEEQFLQEVRQRYNTIPDAVLADADLMELLVPGLRADFAMAEGYRYEAGAPLECPIVACGGAADPHASRSELEAWRGETRSRSSVHVFGGGHLYFVRERAAVTSLIANQLTVLLGALSRCAGAYQVGEDVTS